MVPKRTIGPLGRRLLVAFAAVALVAVGLVAVLSMQAVRTQTTELEAGQRARAERSIVAALAVAYARAGSWEGADLSVARALASAAGLQVVLLDATGEQVSRLEPDPTTVPVPPTGGGPTPTVPPTSSGSGTPAGTPQPSGPSSPARSGVPSSPGRASRSGLAPATATPAVVALLVHTFAAPRAWNPIAATARPAPFAGAGEGIPVVVSGVTVGRALIDAVPAVPVPAEVARQAILRTVGWATLVAMAGALLVSLLVTRRITVPLVALAAAARAVERGDPQAPRLLRRGPGELGEVGEAFARMATNVRRADDARRAMAADVAHELRTPVTVLRGGTEEMLDGLVPVTREGVESLHEEVLRLERLVEDLATLSAAEAAGLSLRPEPVDLGELARRVVTRLRPQWSAAGQQADVTVADRAGPVLVRGDGVRLAQVITNLVVNAVAHTPSGGLIHVDVRAREEQVALTVTDTGAGIPAEDLPHVFERFYRGSSAAGHGTGIGLAVVAGLVRAHGGTVAAASLPGQGAVFTVLLPAPGPDAVRARTPTGPGLR
jgi:two-component system sensor histidine kinase BaeS